MDWFREEIKKAYGGRAPRVLDPFAGGGAILLEAMRLGCEATAIDINPVAWFILKCTLEYPQKLAGQVRPLPKFALESEEFMEAYLKGTGKLSKTQAVKELVKYQRGLFPPPEADLAWHVRAWGWWVLQQAQKDLERFYPTIDDKPTVAYLWARTVTCKNCRATIPLLKTRWLCKTDNKRVLLTMERNVDKTGLVFGVQNEVPVVGENAAQRREYDKKVGAGTMSRSGATCPSCGAIMRMEDMRLEGKSCRLGSVMTAVVVDGAKCKEYRTTTTTDIKAVSQTVAELAQVFADVPFGIPDEPIAGKDALGIRVPLYGFDRWRRLFTTRQLLALGTFVKWSRAVPEAMGVYSKEWIEAVGGYLAMAIDGLVGRCSSMCRPDPSPTQSGVVNTFSRFALTMNWDYIEGVPISGSSGGYWNGVEWIAKVIEQSKSFSNSLVPRTVQGSALSDRTDQYDVIVTDPPYYDAIPYSDLMDFFYVWLRRTVYDLTPEIDAAFINDLAPKWNNVTNDGELIDDESRHEGDGAKSKAAYEDGMYRVFKNCHRSLRPGGHFVIVFANKKADAWETLMSAIVRSGFVVDGSWPIQTERETRMRAYASAALSSSVWLVCKKRPESARPGWDNRVLEEMRQNIHTRLRDYWDAGIRGPDFVWAATGPAMEAYSKHPVVKKANEPGKLMEVSEFLRAVRRLVVDFVVGRVLTGGDETSASGLDDVTTYYILHRHDFGVGDAPVGPCILYAISCNLSDRDLADRFEILLRTGGLSSADDDDEVDEKKKPMPTPNPRRERAASSSYVLGISGSGK